MITRSALARPTPTPAPTRPSPGWRRSLREGVTSLGELCRALALDPAVLGASEAAAAEFSLRVPRSYLSRMRPGDPADPLLLQVLPAAAEVAARSPGYSRDPTGDLEASPTPGLLHKYRGRVLLVTTGACAVHCRYCFRRHFPYAEHQPRGEDLDRALAYITSDPSIHEVILSGGDPLVLADHKLAELAGRLEAIPHLQRLRVHTRLPVVLPERVGEELLAWLAGSRLQPVLVLHANHGNEIDGDVSAALGRLRRAGVTLLNQAVLLRGVNDSATALEELCEKVFAAGALPYYLHLLDPVEGAAHFEVAEARARELVRTLAARLPGYLVPKLVREVPGAPAKTPIDLGG